MRSSRWEGDDSFPSPSALLLQRRPGRPRFRLLGRRVRGLVDGLSPVAYHLERPPGQATFELRGQPVEPSPAILEFVRQIELLPPAARAFWEAATRRVFDIGFESGLEPHCPMHASYGLGPEVLAAVARVRGEIAITVYALDDEKHISRDRLQSEHDQRASDAPDEL